LLPSSLNFKESHDALRLSLPFDLENINNIAFNRSWTEYIGIKMGLQNESHRSTTDEESLALYNNLEHSESSTSTLTLPSQTATPDEVRRFLAQLLIASRDLSQDHAHGIASRWGPGTGRELAKYNAAMYTSIFGPEDGWLLFKDLHILNYKTEQAQMSRLQRYKFRASLLSPPCS
jgi:hypothetical protein